MPPQSKNRLASRAKARQPGLASPRTSQAKPMMTVPGPSTGSQVRQLRSRAISLPGPPNDTSNSLGRRGTAVQSSSSSGRKNLRLAVSARVLESSVQTGVTTRTSGRVDAKKNSPLAVRTRSSASGCRSARITLTKLKMNTRKQEQQRSATVSTSDTRALKSVNRVNRKNAKGVKSSQKKTSQGDADKTSMSLRTSAHKLPKDSQDASSGCQEKVSPPDQASESNLHPLPCPLSMSDTCGWEGILSESVDHILKNHLRVRQTTGPQISIAVKNWNEAGPMQWITLQTCLGQNFLVMLHKVERNNFFEFFGTVNICSHQEDADRFEYRMALKTPSKAFSYRNAIRPLSDGTNALKERDCFVFDTSHAKIFSLEGTFTLDVNISVMK